jgi:predicted nucleic acid-binding protein
MHARASAILTRAAQSGGRFVTTDYILDETATLLRARRHGYLAGALFETVFSSRACRVEWMDPESFAQTRGFFLKHHDQDWSFTDCFSFGLMRRLRIHDALTTDAHFRQAGFNPLLV